jgi:bromodomain-containing factor 1
MNILETLSILFVNLFNLADDVPNYKKIIKKPMWLQKVKSKLDAGEYKKSKDFFKDIKLIWKNCEKYNRPDSTIYNTAVFMGKETETLIKQYETYKSYIDKNSKQPAIEHNSPEKKHRPEPEVCLEEVKENDNKR